METPRNPQDPPTRSDRRATRREFLVKAGAAGAAISAAACTLPPNLNKSRKLAAVPPPEPPPAGEPIRMGIIGVGGMGGGHLHAFLNFHQKGTEKVDIVALSDVAQPRLDDGMRVLANGQKGVEVTAYPDYRDLLKRPDIHAVLIATPEHWHFKHAIDAIRAGKDVYCEKPMSLRLWQALEVEKVVRDSDRMFNVGTQHIMQPKYGEARKLVRAGAIGKLVWSQTSYCRNSKDGEWNYYGIDKRIQPGKTLDWKAWCGPNKFIPWDPLVYHRWRRYKDWSTGIIGDLLVHVMTPLVWAQDLGWPKRVVATGDHVVDLAMENHDQVNLLVDFEGGHQMVVSGSTANEIGLETLIRGHKGTIYLGGGNCVMRPERIFADEVEEKVVRLKQVADQDEMRLAWLRSIRTRETPPGNIDLATKMMVAVDLATRSMWEGHAFVFDRDKNRTLRA